MIKKDLLFPRLTKYGDTPEMYVAWKSSIKNVLSELCISPAGEVNLLVKWFGQNSLNQALRIRTSNTEDPSQCLQKKKSRKSLRVSRDSGQNIREEIKIASFHKLSDKDNNKCLTNANIFAKIDSACKIKVMQLFMYLLNPIPLHGSTQ